MTGGTLHLEVESVEADGDASVTARHRSTAQREGRNLADRVTMRFAIADGRVTEAVQEHGDQAASDAFWS